MKTTRTRQRLTDYGLTWWWQEVEGKATDPAKLRPSSMADGVSRYFGPSSAKETQVTVSENHPNWKKAHLESTFRGDIGGEFSMSRSWVEFNAPPVLMFYRINRTGPPPYVLRQYRYGPILPMNPSSVVSYPVPPSASSEAGLDAWGAKAIAQCKPTNAVADVSTFLGEIVHQGLPKLIGANLWKDQTREYRRRSRRARSTRHKVADEYLNWEYGWHPIARDIGQVAYAIADAGRIMAQYQRDSGKLVRRRFEFPPQYTSTFSVIDSTATATLPSFSAGPFGDGKQGRLIRERETLTRRWFSGAFTYYLPKDGNVYDDMRRSAAMARHTLGLSLTPDVVWNLTPWSWAVDWFTNAGDVISNLTSWAVDGLCLRYGYMMEHTRVTDTYSLVDGTGLSRTSYIPHPLKYCRETKLRRKANPFGFGKTWNGLSPIQLAIAAALGISRT